ncbi:MAG: sugar phosphate nucleotidyltransferase [Terriglobales bacterium]
MLGIVPAAGRASRLQPLPGSKELLPLGWEHAAAGDGGRLRVVSDHILDRMRLAGAERICLVVAPEKADLLRFYGASDHAGQFLFVVQPRPAGLCDAVFRAAPCARPDEAVLIGLPDTVWYPRAAYARSLDKPAHLITFPVAHPEEFDAVVAGAGDRVARVEVKQPGPPARRVWGAMHFAGSEFHALCAFWRQRGQRDQYLGDLLNAWIASGREVTFDCQGTHYWDIGSPAGYARALADQAGQTDRWDPEAPRALPASGG